MDDPFAGWVSGPDVPRMECDEVHVWGWILTGDPQELASLTEVLSNDERARMRRLRFAADQDRYVRARGGLRKILGRYLAQKPEAIRFEYGEYGKPALATREGLHFNLGHTGRIAVAAFSLANPLGVDVEEWPSVVPSLSGHIFSERECKLLKTICGEEHTRAFFNGWTRKEAICKAEGLGLQLPMQEFSVSLLPKDEACIETAGGVLSRAWQLVDLDLAGEVSGSLAIAMRSKIRLFRLGCT